MRFDDKKKGLEMCASCSYGEMLKTTTTHTVDIDGNIIVVKNVPCNECNHCGSVFYDDKTASKLEKIVNKEKQNKKELTLVDFCAA